MTPPPVPPTTVSKTPATKLGRAALSNRQILEEMNVTRQVIPDHPNGMQAALQGSPMVTTAAADSPGGNSVTNASSEFAGQLPPPPTPATSFANMANQLEEQNFRKSVAPGMTVRQQEKEMEDLRRQNLDLKIRLDSLQGKMSKMSGASNESLINENMEYRANNEALKAEVKAYKQMLELAKSEAEELRLRPRHSSDGEEISQLKAEIERVTAQYQRAQKYANTVDGQLNQYDEEMRQASIRIKQLEMELSQANKRYLESQSVTKGLNEEIMTLEQELQKRSDTIRKLSARLSDESSAEGVSEEQLRNLQTRIQELELDRERLAKERDALRKSSIEAESPRTSMDVLETRFLREIGNAGRKLTDLERQQSSTREEKESLQSHARRIGMENALAISCLQKCVTWMNDAQRKPPLEALDAMTLPQVQIASFLDS